MYETLLRPMDVSQVPVLQPVGEISEKLKQAERKREDKRLKQIAAGRMNTSKRKREDAPRVEESPHDASDADDAMAGSKRIKTDDEDNTNPDLQEPPQIMDLDPRESLTLVDGIFTASTPSLVSFSAAAKISVSKALSEVRGHTSYLTFASLQPFSPTQAESEPSTAAVTPDAQTVTL